MTFNTPRYSW